MGRVDRKVTVITGGANGIGRATCELLAREGARVAITDIADNEGEQVAVAIRAAGGQACYWHLNVTNERQVDEVFNAIEQAYGTIDVLVNNAGIIGADKPTHELSVADWHRVMDINVLGVFLCTKRALIGMRRERSGSIVNLSSIYGIISAPDVPPYHASKGAVRMMSKTDALLYASDGIRVNSVHPGFIWTPMVEDFAAGKGNSVADSRASIGALHPLGHLGEPIDVAYGILYLASDEAKFITGTELVIDGGYTAR